MDARERLEVLKARSNEELYALAEIGEGEFDIEEGRKVQYMVWHDVDEHGVHRIVVGRYDQALLGLGEASVVGFAIETSGERRPLTVEEAREFL